MLHLEKLTWSKRIVVLRSIRGWSQKIAAEKCNTNQKNYWAWESGKSYPRKNSRTAIAKAFEVEEKDIFKE